MQRLLGAALPQGPCGEAAANVARCVQIMYMSCTAQGYLISTHVHQVHLLAVMNTSMPYRVMHMRKPCRLD